MMPPTGTQESQKSAEGHKGEESDREELKTLEGGGTSCRKSDKPARAAGKHMQVLLTQKKGLVHAAHMQPGQAVSESQGGGWRQHP